MQTVYESRSDDYQEESDSGPYKILATETFTYSYENIMENGTFAPQMQMSHFSEHLNYFFTFQRGPKALVWSKGLTYSSPVTKFVICSLIFLCP